MILVKSRLILSSLVTLFVWTPLFFSVGANADVQSEEELERELNYPEGYLTSVGDALEELEIRSAPQCHQLLKQVIELRHELRREVLAFCNDSMPEGCQQSCFEKAITDSNPLDASGRSINSLRINLGYTRYFPDFGQGSSQFHLKVKLSNLWKGRVSRRSITCILPENAEGYKAIFMLWQEIEEGVAIQHSSLCEEMIQEQRADERRYYRNLLDGRSSPTSHP